MIFEVRETPDMMDCRSGENTVELSLSCVAPEEMCTSGCFGTFCGASAFVVGEAEFVPTESSRGLLVYRTNIKTSVAGRVADRGDLLHSRLACAHSEARPKNAILAAVK